MIAHVHHYVTSEHNLSAQGQRFYLAGSLLHSHVLYNFSKASSASGEHSLLVPTFVNLSFASEALMKGLLAANDISYEKKHSLSSLFSSLPEKLQKVILSNMPICNTSDEVLGQLKKHDSVFVQLRYLEDVSPGSRYNLNFMQSFADSLSLVSNKEGLSTCIDMKLYRAG